MRLVLPLQSQHQEPGDEGPTENEDTASPWMRCLQGSLGVGELQRWVEHGSAEQTRGPARARSLPKPTKGLSAEHLKFNLHAGVRVPGGLPAARERLLRYCARPPPCSSSRAWRRWRRHRAIRWYASWSLGAAMPVA